MELLNPTLRRIADTHLRGNDALFLEGLIEAAEMFGLIGTEAKLVAFAEQWQGKPTQASHAPAPQASISEARQEAEREGRLAGATAERNRIRAILTDPLAADRWDAARHLAFGTDMSAAEAVALLQTVKPATPADALKSLPAHVARACNSPTGLVGFNAQAGTIATVEAGGAPAGATLGFCPAPDPFVQASPKAKAAASWKKVTGQLNAEADHSIQA